MRELRDSYRDDPRVAAAAAALAGDRDLVIGACHGGLIPVLLAALCVRDAAAERPRLIVCNDPQTLVDDLEELGVVAACLPELDRFEEGEDVASGGAAATIDRTGHNRRMAALEAFSAGAVLVGSPPAVEQPVPDIQQVVRSSIVVRPGEEHPMQALVERLVEAGYKVTGTVEARGEAAVRGGIIDVFPWIGQDPLRIEFFGDQVDSIRRFDAFSQESIARIDEAVLASSTGGLAIKSLWEQLPNAPVVVIGDVSLRARLKKDHKRHELRFARQLEQGAVDGASLGVERLRGDLRRGLVEVKATSDVRRPTSDVERSAIILLARNDEAKLELEANCADHGIVADIRIGRLSAGFRDLERGITVAHDFELAEREPVKRRSARIAGGAPLSSLTDLKRNDYVVHLRHGIGRFKGVATLEKRGFLEDFLLIEFAEDTKLYVPVDAIDLVQKYVGATGRAPELSKIGGQAWAKKRAKAERAVQDMAAELLRNAARRAAAGGLAFAADTADIRRFESSFPYEETEDQLAAVREVKADMERPQAMDRLLCGDVGFGKTEVAMRAAFKAVASGYQVAVLVPTTLLAEQHLESFTERFAGFKGKVAGLNRFHENKARAKVLAGVKAGTVDILIGTHAILTDKLAFANLGLLVIDEEHRFGVKQKEKIKAVRAGCDVLTLSATPIPRTLHFSLLGLRDISVLAEAPAERLAVETRVAPWDDQLVRHALERELERKGQVFVVHNRVADLDALAFRLSRLVPAIKLDTIHGQMDEDRIARVMEAFRHKQLDCLVTTSIIESGIDIPNANTLFVNNAHFFGLAELHQIRGRIGRFSRQAYAYFLTPPNRDLGEEARERLNAIQEYAELGAGFKLAMRDLELRGAGNLLGAEQSGQIDAIGYELYTKLLHESVARMKAGQMAVPTPDSGPRTPDPIKASDPGAVVGDKLAQAMGHHDTGETQLALAVDAYIPDTWLETPALKFELHKQLDVCRRLSDLAHLARSARDRYGALAQPVARLFQIRAIRLRAKELGVKRIDVQDRHVRLHLAGALPKELASVKLPELVHLQLDGSILVLFLKVKMDQDLALSVLCRLLSLDLGFLGKGF
ncbi:MAG: transcription-repair coupling factor [Planctomycetes bacterium]|nr:transcription-repair coupling factor [Planctomycetota bacterium]